MTAAEVVRSWYAARARGAFDEALELMAEGVVWHIPGRSPVAGDHSGRQAVAERFREFRERSRGGFHSQLLDLCAAERNMVALVRNTAAVPGAQLDSHQALQFRVDRGRIAEIWIYIDDLYAVDAFWSAT